MKKYPTLYCFPLNRIGNLVQIHCPFIGAIVKDVQSLCGLRSLLFVAKDQIYPVVQVLADVLRLQSPPVDGNELLGSGGPGRQNDIVDLLFGDLQMAQVESVRRIKINPNLY